MYSKVFIRCVNTFSALITSCFRFAKRSFVTCVERAVAKHTSRWEFMIHNTFAKGERKSKNVHDLFNFPSFDRYFLVEFKTIFAYYFHSSKLNFNPCRFPVRTFWFRFFLQNVAYSLLSIRQIFLHMKCTFEHVTQAYFVKHGGIVDKSVQSEVFF